MENNGKSWKITQISGWIVHVISHCRLVSRVPVESCINQWYFTRQLVLWRGFGKLASLIVPHSGKVSLAKPRCGLKGLWPLKSQYYQDLDALQVVVNNSKMAKQQTLTKNYVVCRHHLLWGSMNGWRHEREVCSPRTNVKLQRQELLILTIAMIWANHGKV